MWNQHAVFNVCFQLLVVFIPASPSASGMHKWERQIHQQNEPISLNLTFKSMVNAFTVNMTFWLIRKPCTDMVAVGTTWFFLQRDRISPWKMEINDEIYGKKKLIVSVLFAIDTSKQKKAQRRLNKAFDRMKSVAASNRIKECQWHERIFFNHHTYSLNQALNWWS